MTASPPLRVAIPWSLSHYIPLNGFHPLYRALFDHVPAGVELNAWDNVKLQRHFHQNNGDLRATLELVERERFRTRKLDDRSVAKAYEEYLFAPNKVLTEALAGDVELHHTAPFASLSRPFVFHCESFAPVFLPFAQQGSGSLEKHDELRDHYRRILGSPLCLGIHSHIPETLESLSFFFRDKAIDGKLTRSRIGLSKKSFEPDYRPKGPLSTAKFLFINSAHQNPANFFRRGGHIALQFWKEFLTQGKTGKLTLRCKRPKNADLIDHQVDTEFVAAETGRSIVWVEDFLANHELNRLMADAHFLLLPSASLHSATILQAMTLGAVPIITDTVGTSVYADDDSGIVLRGMRDAIWFREPVSGILFDRYQPTPSLDRSLASQITQRVRAMLDCDEGHYASLKSSAMKRADTAFSGESFSQDFWSSVSASLAAHTEFPAKSSTARSSVSANAQKCVLDVRECGRVFESVPQPVRRIYTGSSSVFELGGAMVHVPGNPSLELHEWSALAGIIPPHTHQTVFAYDLIELNGLFLRPDRDAFGERSRLVGWISGRLMPFPQLHSSAARQLKKFRSCRTFARLARRYIEHRMGRGGSERYTELVAEDVFGFNVIKYFHKYFAIPKSEGAFDGPKAEAKAYSTVHMAYSFDRVLKKLHDHASAGAPVPPTRRMVGRLARVLWR